MSEQSMVIPPDILKAAEAAWQCADNREDRGVGSVLEIAAVLDAERHRAMKAAGDFLMTKTDLDVHLIVDCQEAIRTNVQSSFSAALSPISKE